MNIIQALTVNRKKSHVLGWMPELSLLSSLGLLILSFANNNARNATPGAEVLFWCGLLVIFIPTTLRLVSSQPSRQERIGLLIVLAISLYLVKILNSPLNFSNYDEFLTWRTAIDIEKTGKLFRWNSLLPVSPYYPGLANVTSALSSLGNLSSYYAGTILLGFARVLFVLGLYLFFEEVGHSELLAGIATLVYMTNPNFLFFDAQFAYESLALPLAIFILYLLVRRASSIARSPIAMTSIIVLGIGAVVITHHITSYALVAFVGTWAVLAFLRNEKGVSNPIDIAIIGLIMCVVWVAFVAKVTVSYLVPNITDAAKELSQILSGEAGRRVLFRSFSGELAPYWERIAGYDTILLIILGLPFGLLTAWKQYRHNTVALTLALGAIAYPFSQVLRFSQSGSVLGVRSTEFLFISVAFVLAIEAARILSSQKPNLGWSMLCTVWISVLFIGGITLGRPPWMRLPGPYLVVADTRSIEAQGIATAQWAQAHLGPDNRIGTDRINGILMGTYGEQYVVTGISDRVPLGTLFLSSDIDQQVASIIKSGDIQYLVVDRRLSEGLPMAGFYFQVSEPGAYRYLKPIDANVLGKFDRLDESSRIYDSGGIVIYDVRAIGRDQILSLFK